MKNKPFNLNFIAPWLRNRWGLILLGFAVYLGIYLLWIIFHDPADPNTLAIADLAYIPLSAFATAGALRVARNPILDAAIRRAWSVMALGFASTVIADLVWFYYEVILQTTPFPSLADVFYLATYILVFAGMILLPTARLGRYEHTIFWLDLSIVMVSAWMLVWYFIVIPAATASSSDLLSQILAAIYPIVDLLMLAGIPAILLRRPPAHIRAALVIFIPGIISYFIADVLFAITTQNGTYATGSFIDFLWPLGLMLFSLSATRQMKLDSEFESATRFRLARLVRILPYAAALSGLGMFVYFFSTLDLTNTSLWSLYFGVLLLLLLVAIRVANPTEAQLSMAPTHQADGPSQLQTRNAFRVTGLLFVASLVYSSSTLYLALQGGGWQLFATAGIVVVLALATGVGSQLIRRGRLGLAIGLTISALLASILITSIVMVGVGLVLAATAVLIPTMMAGLTLPQKQATRVIGISVVVGVATLLIDLFASSSYRLVLPGVQALILVLAAGLILAYSLFVVRQFRNYSLRVKLITAFALVSVLAVAMVGFTVTRVVQSELTDEIEQKLNEVASVTALAMGDELDKQVDELRVFTLSRALSDELQEASAASTGDLAELELLDQQWRTADAAENDADSLVQRVLKHPVSEELHALRENSSQYAEVFVTDRYGAIVASTNHTSDYYQADEEWWQAAYNNGQGGVFISQPEFDQSSQIIGLQIAIPVYGRQTNEVVGVLHTTVDMKFFESILINARFDKSGHVHISLPDDAEIHLQTEPEQLLKIAPARLNVEELVQSAAPSLEVQLTSGAHHIASQSLVTARSASDGLLENETIAGLEWRVVAHQDRAEAFQPLTDISRTVQLAGLVAILIAGSLAFLTSQVLTNPITRLTQVAENVSASHLQTRAAIESSDEIGVLAGAFNSMTAQLQETLAGLEKRVNQRTAELNASRIQSEERARDLQSISEISRIISTEQKLDVLLPLITRLVSENFNFYHTGIFLLDESRRFAVLQAASSEGGQRMLDRGHKLEIGQGIVGNAALEAKTRLALDVGTDAVYFDNPDLPATRSEMALPLITRDHTIGVLDVQSTKQGEFTDNDLNILGILADQIAIAIENARLFEKSNQALNEIQSIYSQYLQREWKALQTRTTNIGYHQSLRGGSPLETPIESPEIQKAWIAGETLITDSNGNQTEPSIVVPIRLRGQTIGVLNIKSPVKNRKWSQEEINLIKSVTDRLAIALENARLFEETNRRAERERLVTEITGKIRSVNDPQAMINMAAEELKNILGASRVQVIPQTKKDNGQQEA